MKINRLEIANFGKFSDYTLDLSNSFQVVYGDNEDGKSTLMAFVEMMFYGDQGRARAIERNHRIKYLPWNGAPMEGAVEFEQGSTKYRLQKLFGTTLARDKISLINLNTNSSVELPDGQEAGTFFFGLDLDGFRRSSFIGQVGRIEVGATGTDMVAERLLSNVASSGDEGFSHQEVIGRIETAMVEMQAKRGAKGILVDAKNDLNDLINEHDMVSYQIKSQSDLTEEYRELETLQKELDNIEKSLQLYNAGAMKRNLEKLMHASTKLEELMNGITTDKYPYDSIPVFLEETSLVLDKQKELHQGLKPFEEISAVLDGSPITQDIFLEFQRQLKIKAQTEELSEFYKNIILPTLNENEKLSKQYNLVNENYKNQKIAMQKLEPDQYKLEQLTARKKEVEALLLSVESRINSKNELSEQQLLLEKEKLDFTKSKYDDANALWKSSSSPNLPLLILGILAVIGSVAGGYFVNKLIFAGAGLGLVLIILAFIKKGSSKLKKQAELMENEYQSANKKYADFENSALLEEENLKKELDFLLAEDKDSESSIEELDTANQQYQTAKKSFSKLELELEQLERNKENSANNLERSSAQLLEKSKKSDEHIRKLITDNQDDLEYIGILIDNTTAESSRSIEGMLKEKNAKNIEEYQQKHLDYQSNQNTRDSAQKLEAKLKSIEAEFTEKISSYRPVNTFSDAHSVFADLKEKYSKFSSIKRELEVTITAIGIDDYSVENIAKKLSQIPTGESSLTPQQAESFKSRLEALKSLDIMSKIKELGGQIQQPKRSLEQIQSETEDLTEQTENMQNYYDSLSLAFTVMEQSQEEMRQSFGPLLDKRTSEIFSDITGGKYSDVVINKDYDIKIKSGVHLRESPYLSSGTIDQAYLSLRLAIAELISQSSSLLPLFLDDVLIQYDDERASKAIKFLCKYSTEHGHQIILFSCHGRMIDLAEKNRILIKTIA